MATSNLLYIYIYIQNSTPISHPLWRVFVCFYILVYITNHFSTSTTATSTSGSLLKFCQWILQTFSGMWCTRSIMIIGSSYFQPIQNKLSHRVRAHIRWPYSRKADLFRTLNLRWMCQQLECCMWSCCWRKCVKLPNTPLWNHHHHHSRYIYFFLWYRQCLILTYNQVRKKIDLNWAI